MKWFVLGITVLMYVLVILFPARKSWAAMGAALLLVVIGAVGPLQAITKLIDWNILLIFVGSLIIAELFIYSRVPAVIADTIMVHSPNAGIAIVSILIMTGIISAFVENVATVLVMAPIALAFCKKLKLNPRMFMAGLAVMANLQGTATLVGDPPSMIFANFAHYDFNAFFVHQGRLSIFFAVQIGMLAGAVFFYCYFARAGREKIDVDREKAKTMVPTVLLLLMIFGLAAFSFIFGGLTIASGLLVMALGVFGFFWYWLTRREGWAKSCDMLKKLDWDTVLFLAGIFVVVGAIAHTGLLEDLAALLSKIIGSNVFLGFFLIIIVSVLISGFVDNVPYIIVMLPVAAALAERLSLKPELYMFALLVGSCLGGNLTPFGASANIVSIGILRQQGEQMSFGRWLKIGVPFTLVTTVASAAFVWLVWN
jgi:Na+/H+ antiporter NhaD/arsenite permease-like protein